MVKAAVAAYLPPAEIGRLVRVALLDDDRARTAWRQGRTVYERSYGEVPPAARWLEPLLGARLESLAPGDALLPAFRARRDATAAANEHRFGHVAELIRILEASGIGVMLLKGAALISSTRDASTRPMSDVDLLVPTADAGRAVEAALAAGWLARHTVTPAFLEVKHAAHFADDDRCQLDLHWYAFEDCCYPGADDRLWERAERAGFQATNALRPGPSDALLHACVHGARWTRTPGVRWVTDAWSYIGRPDLDWSVVLDEARRRRFSLRLHSTLAYLRRALSAPIPHEVARTLDATSGDLLERLEHASLGHEQRRLGELPAYVFTFDRRVRHDGRTTWTDFPAYLGHAWGAASTRDLLVAGLTRARRRLS